MLRRVFAAVAVVLISSHTVRTQIILTRETRSYGEIVVAKIDACMSYRNATNAVFFIFIIYIFFRIQFPMLQLNPAKTKSWTLMTAYVAVTYHIESIYLNFILQIVPFQLRVRLIFLIAFENIKKKKQTTRYRRSNEIEN